MDIRDHQVSNDCQLSLKGGAVSDRRKGPSEHTLKIWRALLRSDFQAAIVSLSRFAWKSRMAPFRLFCLTIFLWISDTVLRFGTQ